MTFEMNKTPEIRLGKSPAEKAQEKVTIDIPGAIADEDYIAQIKPVANKESATKRIKELAGYIDTHGNNTKNPFNELYELRMLANKFDMTYGEVNTAIGQEGWLS